MAEEENKENEPTSTDCDGVGSDVVDKPHDDAASVAVTNKKPKRIQKKPIEKPVEKHEINPMFFAELNGTLKSMVQQERRNKLSNLRIV